MHGIAAVLAFDAMTLFAGQVAHEAEPTSVLNVALAHAMHALAGPEKPKSQTHWSLPITETLFAGQERHVPMLVAARLVEKLLLGHALHCEVPGTVL